MDTGYGNHVRRSAYILLSILILLICLFYTFTGIYLTPYPGFEMAPGWVISRIEPCQVELAWCAANQDTLRVGDQILALGDLTYDAYIDDISLVPFEGTSTGDTISITFLRDGQEQIVDWHIPGHTDSSRLRQMLQTLPMFIPFWLVGTVALFLRRAPTHSREVRWMPVLFNFATAVWLAIGAFGDMRTMHRAIVEHALAWLLVPIYLHFHLVVPTPIFQHRRRRHFLLFYLIAAALATLELVQALPYAAIGVALSLAFVCSIMVLFFRLIARSRSADRPTAALMLAGLVISLGPATVLWSIPTLLGTSLPTGAALYIIRFAFPILPFFYTYAIYKRQLGTIEHRAIRALGLYSFLLVYATIIAAVLSIAGYWLGDSARWMVFGSTAWTLFAIAALPLYTRFQRLAERLAYGTKYSPNEIVYTLTAEVPLVLDRTVWMETLTDILASTLFIRQSALYLLTDKEPDLLYAQGIQHTDAPPTHQQIEHLLKDTGRNLPFSTMALDGFEWVRLAIPLETRDQTTGVWLFGQRDPDDYYPQSMIRLLETLAIQVAVGIENEHLYDQALAEIAERTRMEEALRKSEERLRLVVQNMPVMLNALDAENRFIAWNRECERVTGYSATEIIGNPKALELLYPDDDYRQRVLAEWDRRGDDFRDWELELVAKDGSIRTVAWSNICAQFPIPGWTSWAIGIDVTEQKQAERELRIKDSAIASSISGIAIADPNGNLIYVNRSFIEYWGFTSTKEILGHSIITLWQNQEEAANALDALRGGEGWVGELVAKRKDGSLFDVQLAANTVMEEADVPSYIMISFLDITQRKRAEQRVMRAEQMATMGQIASALAHEVNNPLQTVRANLELLIDFDLAPEERKQRMDIALHEIERLAKMTRRVLDFAKPVRDMLRVVPTAQLVHRALTLLEEQLELAHVQVTNDIPDDSASVFVTPSQIVQVLHNLIVNTIEVLPDGGHLRIAEHRSGDQVTLELINDGPSLTSEQIEHMFDPFFTTKPDGTGLGLYTSRIIIEQHKGTISARNLKDGQGVAFTITLPAIRIKWKQII